jgi:hypothetical protein
MPKRVGASPTVMAACDVPKQHSATVPRHAESGISNWQQLP